jgi:Spy/CpxP family protein refolding chaperone
MCSFGNCPSKASLIGVLVMLAVAGGCQRDSTGTDATAPARLGAGDQRVAAGTSAAERHAHFTKRAWWNQPDLIDALQLTGEQRTRMDALLRRWSEAQPAVRQQQRDAQLALKNAIAAADWTAARAAAATAGQSMSAQWTSQAELKIDVLAMLNPTQHDTVSSRYRYLLHQTSVLTRAGRPRARAGARPAAEP